MFPTFRVLSPNSPSKAPSGAALVLVLAALALISFLLVAIMTLVQSESRGSETSAELVQARMLSTLPEKLVISQIRRATGTPDAGDQLSGIGYNWASQPGMISVFGATTDDSKARSDVHALYKLYSSRKLVLKGTETTDPNESPLNEANRLADAMTAEKFNPAEIVDLNEPVRVGTDRNPFYAFPILDPKAYGLVDGFKVHAPSTDAADENAPVQASADMYNPSVGTPKLAMPVSWLYVLQDGSIISPGKGSTQGTADFGGNNNGSAKPSVDNPIVGRIAYWTDDDSCKLNVNTATEPSPWESPHTHTTTDVSYAKSIPAKGEYYRNSGHPAYTSLAPVLRHFGSQGSFGNDPKREPANTLNDDGWQGHIIDWHQWLPRTFDETNTAKGTLGGTQPPTAPVDIKKDRLFASIDELIYTSKTDPTGEDGRTTYPAMYQGGNVEINADDLSKVRFFLTTHNRAPELNLFNRPKISLWPLMESATTRTEIDKKFALASTIGSDIYYFQRQQEWTTTSAVGSSQTGQLELGTGKRNTALFGYLQDLSERNIPGFGGKFVDPTGGAGGKMTATGRDQLLVSMFDFIRSGVNTEVSKTQTLINPTYNYTPPVAPPVVPPNVSPPAGGGSSVPLEVTSTSNTIDSINSTKGYGRFPTITKVAIVFFASKASTTPSRDFPLYADQTKAIEAFVILEPFTPSPGTTPFAPRFSCDIVGLDNFRLDTLSLGFPLNTILTTTFDCPASAAGSTAFINPNGNPSWGGDHSAYVGLSSQFLSFNSLGAPVAKNAPPPAIASNATNDFMAAIPSSFTIPPAANASIPTIPAQPAGTVGTRMIFSGGPVSIDIKDPLGNIVQTIDMVFPATEIPVPAMPIALAPVFNAQTPAQQYVNRFKVSVVPGDPKVDLGNLGAPSEYRLPLLIQPGDVVRSMELAGAGATFTSTQGAGNYAYKGAINGDARLLAARRHLQASAVTTNAAEHYLIPHADYFKAEGIAFPVTAADSETGRNAQSLRDGAYMATPSGLPPPAATYKSDPQFGFVMTGTPPVFGPQLTNLTGGGLAVRTAPSLNTGLLPYPVTQIPAVPPSTRGAINADGLPGDFDNGPGIIEDGPYINMPDTGNAKNQSTTVAPGLTNLPFLGPSSTAGYFDRGGLFSEDNGVTYSPWRQISSAIAFGSLPTGAYGWRGDPITPRPWQTLLFCPNPASRTTPAGTEPDFPTKKDHFGFELPRDHLWLENFWMPAIEPSGLCEGLSTEGKVNMNYQIMPFLWIKRATAMHGALHGVRITAIPSDAVTAGAYKNPLVASTLEFRYAVDADKTLDAFDDRFFSRESKTTDVFRSPSEICEMFLIPKRMEGHNYENTSLQPQVVPPNPSGTFANGKHNAYKSALDWWKGSKWADSFDATGDNLREAPYAQLYPRLCTRSNVYTVHYRVQVLRKSRSTKPTQWVEGSDRVAAEYRGQATIERYLDPATQFPSASPKQTIPDFATTVDSGESLDDYYKYKVINRRRFSP